MAIFVYRTSNGVLVSQIPENLTIAQAQALGQLASAAQLNASGLAAVDGQPMLDSSHAWDAGTHTVISVTPPKSTVMLKEFWKRFTDTERESIEDLAMTGTAGQRKAVMAFFRYVQAAGSVDCNDSYIQAKVNQLETVGTIASGRAAQILV